MNTMTGAPLRVWKSHFPTERGELMKLCTCTPMIHRRDDEAVAMHQWPGGFDAKLDDEVQQGALRELRRELVSNV